ncbi:beta-glucosidase family protein [Flindersiella endophytica]
MADTDPRTETAIEERLASLTLEEKVGLLTGADAWSLPPAERIGLRAFVMSDGPVGVRGTLWDERDTSANLPSPTALAASWDEQLVHRLGLLLAAEARRKGVDMLLAPTVNLHRSPLGGRHFECYSEDPLLTSRIGVAYVRGVQEGGVAATVKHFVGNDSETQRMTVDVRMNRRALRELYLAPFEAIVREGGAWAVMAAYNSVDGTTMTESPLLADILRQEWGFDGVVVSDWTAARSTEASARAALDLVMPGPDGPWGAALVAAVREGKVPEPAIDEKVRRLLRIACRTGALADGPVAVEPPVFLEEDVSALVREAAADGFVLARNEDLLPLSTAELRQVAVLGPNAASARTQGGGSATVFPPYVVSPLDGLRSALGPAGVEVVHTPGARATRVLPPLASAAHVRFLDAAETPVGQEDRDTTRFLWLGSYGPDVDASQVRTIEATATIQAVASGAHGIGITGTGHFKVYVGDEVVIDETLRLPEGSEEFEAVVRPPHTSARVQLSAGTTATVRVVHTVPEHPFVAFGIGHEEPRRSDAEELAAAAELAALSDVAIVVVGTTAEIESEGFDRDTLALPGNQDELVRAVVGANPRTIVVVNSGSPVELPWADSVGAVLLSWFPGQEFGSALADVLLGEREPGGRLPTTWPVVAADCPVLSTTPVDGVLSYDESLHVGYRGWARSGRTPRYAFGHGLGYTTWECVDASWPSVEQVRVSVRNTGSRTGRTVVQAYLSKPGSRIDRPALWLAGFAVVEAGAGEVAEAELLLSSRAFEHWDEEAGEWRTEAGPFELSIGPASDVVWRRLSAAV